MTDVCPHAHLCLGQAPPAYHFFDTKTSFSRMGHMTPPGRTFIGCLSAMGADCDEFVAGETTGNGQVRWCQEFRTWHVRETQ